ncbi:Sec23/Sec24 trunk domain containing protein [Balamuthia mandrillaris]
MLPTAVGGIGGAPAVPPQQQAITLQQYPQQHQQVGHGGVVLELGGGAGPDAFPGSTPSAFSAAASASSHAPQASNNNSSNNASLQSTGAASEDMEGGTNIVRSSSTKVLRSRAAWKSSGGLPSGFLLSPLIPVPSSSASSSSPTSNSSSWLRRAAVRCTRCQAYVNKYCDVSGLKDGRWRCVFCSHLNSHPEEYSEPSCALFPEFTRKVVDYLDPTLQPPQKHASPLLGPLFVLVVDANLVQDDLEVIGDSIKTALSSVAGMKTARPGENGDGSGDESQPGGRASAAVEGPPPRVSIVAFSTTVSIYELNPVMEGMAVGSAVVASAEVFSGVAGLLAEDRAYIAGKAHAFTAEINEGSMECVDRVLEALIFSAPKEKQPIQQRCLGTALEAALTLINASASSFPSPASFAASLDEFDDGSSSTSSHQHNGGRVVVFMNGGCNLGPGRLEAEGEQADAQKKQFYREEAAAYFKKLDMQALTANASIDLFCCGLKRFNVPVLQNLVLGNGGAVIMQKEFGAEFAITLELTLHRGCGRDGHLSIQCSSPIVFTHIIGPAVASNSDSDSSETARHEFRMGCVTPSLCYSLFYSVGDDTMASNVYFQFVVRYTNYANQCILRIITQRLETTANFSKFCASVDAHLTAILLAKKIILLSRKVDNPTEAITHLDKTLVNISKGCGQKDKFGLLRLPAELAVIPRLMYLLRRGPMLSPILQHPDDIDFLRCLFLNANFEDSLRLIDPPLLLADTSVFQRIPLQDLALQSNFVLLLDHHTDIFIWIGNEATHRTDLVELCRRYASQVAKDRWPQPQLMIFKEGSSMARCLQCRLIPSHQDSLEEQRHSFPQIMELSQQQYAKLMSKFHRTDEISYSHYYRKLLSA